MHRIFRLLTLLLAVLPVLLVISSSGAAAQAPSALKNCTDFAYSTEEDFITRGPLPIDGNPVISDGDLLSRNHTVCMRNRELLAAWEETIDLGLDGVDILSADQNLVSFSTELDDPYGRFTSGDLLSTWGTAIPNQALLVRFQIQGDRGLDAIQWMGSVQNIIAFHQLAREIPREQWLQNPGRFIEELQRYQIDVWFSIEQTERRASVTPVYDGDVLSAATGAVVLRNSDLLPASVPAGLTSRGVDFGLDALAVPRSADRDRTHFSTEILYRGKPAFTDGDVLKINDGIVVPDKDLALPWEPLSDFLGTDALYINFEPQATEDGYLPLILRLVRELLP